MVADLAADRIEVVVPASAVSPASSPATQPWDSRRMNLSGLRLFNAATKVSLKELVLSNARIAPGQIDANLSDGVLSINVAEFRTYNGSGQGRLVVDASQEIPTQSLRLSVTRIEALPLLMDVFKFPHLAGQMQAHAVFQSKGDSPAAIVAGLDGTARVLIRERHDRGSRKYDRRYADEYMAGLVRIFGEDGVRHFRRHVRRCARTGNDRGPSPRRPLRACERQRLYQFCQ